MLNGIVGYEYTSAVFLMLGTKIRRQLGFKHSLISPFLFQSGMMVSMTSFFTVSAHTKSWNGLGKSKTLVLIEQTEASKFHSLQLS